MFRVRASRAQSQFDVETGRRQQIGRPELIDAATAAVLDFVAARVRAQGEAPPVLLLEQLGADYFKYAALQLERVSPEMALQLMSLALHLRPEAEFINERVEHYREKLAKE